MQLLPRLGNTGIGTLEFAGRNIQTASKNDSGKIDVVIMATADIDAYAKETLANWRAYCSRHGYALYHYDEQVLPDLHINWSKIELAKRHLQQSDCDWMVVADADTWVCDPSRTLDEFIDDKPGIDFVFSSDVCVRAGLLFPLNYLGVWECRAWICPNAGFFAVRRSREGQMFMDEWMELPYGRLEDLADRPPRDQWILWRGLFRKWKDRLRLDKRKVLRVISDFHWWQLKVIGANPLIAHDKRLTLRLKRNQKQQP